MMLFLASVLLMSGTGNSSRLDAQNLFVIGTRLSYFPQIMLYNAG